MALVTFGSEDEAAPLEPAYHDWGFRFVRPFVEEISAERSRRQAQQ